MRTLVVGIGALGGTLATRALAAGMPVSLATRSVESARALRWSGLRLAGGGGPGSVQAVEAAALDDYADERFDLIVLATKAHDALSVAPSLARLGGTVL